jgi:hypothetical protein
MEPPPIVRPTPQPQFNLRMIIGGAALVVGVIVIILLLVRPGPKKPGDHGGNVTATPTPTPSPTAVPTATATASASAALTPPPQTANPQPPYTSPVVQLPVAFDLAAAIADAAPGATIKVPAGFYHGGFVVRQPVHLVGQTGMTGMTLVQSEGKPALSVEAKGVSVDNIQFNTQGIGNLPAVAVGKGAELSLDGCSAQSASALAMNVAEGGTLKTVGSSFSSARGTAIRLDAGAKGDFTQTAFSNSLVGLSLTTGATAQMHACAFDNDGMNDSNGAVAYLAGEKTQLAGDDCHFTNNSAALSVADHAALALQNSSFKSNGGSEQGLIGLIIASRGGQVRLTNTTFESNRTGLLATAAGQLELQKCSFDKNGVARRGGVAAGVVPLSVAGEGSTGVVRQSSFIHSVPYAISVIAGGRLALENSEISGSSEIGLLAGDRGAPGGVVQIKRTHFLGNGVGLGLCAGASAVVEESEFRENKDGVVAIDQNSNLSLTKSKLLTNRSQGLHVFSGASATVTESELRENDIGAMSGTRGKSNQRGSITLAHCSIGGNTSFGAVVARDSQLTLDNSVFNGPDRTAIYKERGAIVTENTPPPEPSSSPEPEASPSPAASASPEESESPAPSPSPSETETPSPSPESKKPADKHPKHRPTPKPHPPTPEDIHRFLRKLLPGGG